VKILAIAEFDPAGVLGGHRRALRARGIDYRIATHVMYREPPRDGAPDWNLAKATWLVQPSGSTSLVPMRHVIGSREELIQFAREADVVQFHPVIGQPWSFEQDVFRHDPCDENAFGGVVWEEVLRKDARRIAYFHGSKNLQKNAIEYAQDWTRRGYELWTSTLDYVVSMGAAYAPPIVDAHYTDGFAWPAARLRRDSDPLHLCHAPTDKSNCHTNAFIDMCLRVGVVFDIYHGLEHSKVVRYKARRNVGFDHLRGSFSVNTVENCLIGIVPLVGMSPTVMEAWHRNGLGVMPWPWIKDANNGGEAELESVVRKLQADPSWHRDIQVDVRRWVQNEFGALSNTNRLEKLYHG
jgi:hypothetical protein